MKFLSNRQIAEALQHLGGLYRARPLSSHKTDKLIFLCGANRAPNTPSHRREAVKKFVQSLNGFKVIYAEPVFNELTRINAGKGRKNALDLEHEITQLVDQVIIVMESAGAICELGAFAHSDLRDKLIIVNDRAHQSQKSFINEGPLTAVADSKGTVLWYSMDHSVVEAPDAIGATFNDLTKALDGPARGQALDLPTIQATKGHLYFVHDLIYLLGPVSYKEITAALNVMFGYHAWDVVSSLIAVLRSAELIASVADGVYKCKLAQPFYKHPPGFGKLAARMRHYHLQNNPERFALGSFKGDDSGGTRPSPNRGERRARRRAA